MDRKDEIYEELAKRHVEGAMGVGLTSIRKSGRRSFKFTHKKSLNSSGEVRWIPPDPDTNSKDLRVEVLFMDLRIIYPTDLKSLDIRNRKEYVTLSKMEEVSKTLG